MGVFDSINDVSDKAIGSGENYISASRKFYRLKLLQVMTKSSSTMAKILLIGGLCFLGLVFLIVAGAIWLAQEIGNLPLAFLIVASVLFVIAIILFLLGKQINKIIIKKISKDFFD